MRFFVLAVLAAWTMQAQSAAAIDFKPIVFPGALETHPWDVNSFGVVVGGYRLPDGGGFHGFVYKDGVFETIDAPNTESTVLYGINDQGAVVGVSGGSSIVSSFRYVGGDFSEITLPGATSVVATDINNENQVLGYWSDDEPQSGFTWSLFVETNGAFQNYDPPLGEAAAYALADDGTFAGWAMGQGFLHGSNGYEFLPIPGTSYPHGLNNLGEIVGAGFYYHNGKAKYFSVGPSDFTIATGINDSGLIVGYYHDYRDGVERGFMFERVELRDIGIPEPSTWALMILGFCTVGMMARQRAAIA
jgi:hypothetical protein